jgi:predicted nuclease with TOPRIM domain
MDTQYWLGNVITTVVGALVGFLLGRKKYNKEVDNLAITNMQESLDFYKKLSDDTCARLENVLNENATLRDEIKQVRSENSQLKEQMNELRTVVDKLTATLAKYGLDRMLKDVDSGAFVNSRKINNGDGKESKEAKPVEEKGDKGR